MNGFATGDNNDENKDGEDNTQETKQKRKSKQQNPSLLGERINSEMENHFLLLNQKESFQPHKSLDR